MPTMDLTPEEARHLMKRRRSERRDELFKAGLEAAATLLESGSSSIREREMAAAIRKLKRPRNTKKET